MESIKIMVVDDTSFMRTMMRSILEELGHHVVAEAGNGVEAIQTYKLVRPELVTMDITMPELDGISAVKEIKQVDPSAKIIMCSALGHRSMIIEAIRSGASDFILKPVHKDRVAEAIHNAFNNANRILEQEWIPWDR